jgi:RHS repeat-associated protein
MKKLLYIFLGLPLLTFGQTDTQNYVSTRVYKEPTATSDASKANTSVTYVDGFGRPIQQVAGKQSGAGKDIITHIEYDAYGRQARQYLPFAAATDNLAFDAAAQANTVTFYSNANFQNTSNPWSETFFEASPAGRTLKQSAPGTPWAGNPTSDTDRTLKFAYLTNTDYDNVKKLTATAGAISNRAYSITFTDGGYYEEGKLYKTITQDENKASAIYRGDTGMQNKLNTTEEYKDIEGRVILKRTFVSQTDNYGMPGIQQLNTYYVYDQFGNLTYVLPPLAGGSISQADALCYQYKYDARNRLVEKKLPGKAWEFIVYDSQDRVVATGPALNPWGTTNPTAQGWLVTQYDAFGRVAFTGWFPDTSTINAARRNTLQGLTYAVSVRATASTTIDGIPVFYTNTLPTAQNIGANFKLLSVNYYDDYRFLDAQTAPTASTQVEEQNVMITAKGLATGGLVRVLDLPSGITVESSYVLFDVKARPVRTRSTNYLGGYTRVDSKLGWDGKIEFTKTRHKRTAASNTADSEIITQNEYSYTDQDRVLALTHKIGNQPPQLMAHNTYDAMGRLVEKKVGNTESAPLQKVDYSYNVRGWLTGINDILDLNNGGVSSQPQDLFAFKINYSNPVEFNFNGAVKSLYNGNIAEISWRTASDNIQRRYGFSYDETNRLLDARYQIPQSSVQERNTYNEHLTYDANGNIKTLLRYGEQDGDIPFQIDDLTYTYEGNRLMKVSDATNQPAGFKDINLSNSNDYGYDAYGNLTSDVNKGITSVIYNHQNLPVTITISGTTGGTISYLYDGDGIKLKKTVTPNSGPTVITDYLGGYQYVGGVLEFFPTSEGYVKHTVVDDVSNFTYVFQYNDHLGNNRISYSVDPNDNVLKILEEDHYYPFGLKHNGYSANQRMIKGTSGVGVVIVPVVNPADVSYMYMYQGQELQRELGLGWYSFTWRNYNPEIGRFFNLDPLAEEYYAYTCYQFSSNQVVHASELEGLENSNDLNKMLVKNDAIPKQRIITEKAGERAYKSSVKVATTPPQPYKGPMISQSPPYEEQKRYTENAKKKLEAIEMSKNIVSNHDNIGSPYTALRITDGVAQGVLMESAGAIISKGVSSIRVFSSALEGGFAVEVPNLVVTGADTLEPGIFAGESIPARGAARNFTAAERNAINEIGNNTGCHTCGTTQAGTKSGNFVPDHQPPSALAPSTDLYPQCIDCSRMQGGTVSRIIQSRQ